MSNSNPPIPDRGPNCPPAFELEWASEQFPNESSLSDHLKACASCQAYVEHLRLNQDAFLKARPPELFLSQLERRTDQPTFRHQPLLQWAVKWKKAWVGGVAAVSVAGAALMLVLAQPSLPEMERRLKGSSFAVLRESPDVGTWNTLKTDAQVRPGEALRFSFQATKPGYLMVLELDGSGRASVFYPFEGLDAAQVNHRDAALLPGTVELDDSSGPVWLLAVYAERPFAAAPILAQLRAQPSTAPRLKIDCDRCIVETVRLQKR